MSVHIAFHKTCDRCLRPFDHQGLSYEGGLPTRDPRGLVLTDGGKQVFSYDDLCPKCDGVVKNLIKKLTLDTDKETEIEAEKTPKEATPEEPEAVPEDGKTHPF